jgi:hypothetical protein
MLGQAGNYERMLLARIRVNQKVRAWSRFWGGVWVMFANLRAAAIRFARIWLSKKVDCPV